MKTLQLNIGYEPISLISWKKAVKKLIQGKAEVLAVQSAPLRSAHITTQKPAVIRLFKYHRNYGQVKLTRENIFARDQYICQYCCKKFKSNELTLDHVLPRSRGGLSNWSNLATSCAPCNNKKDRYTPQEIDMPLLRKPFKPAWMPAVLVKTIKSGKTPKQWTKWISWIEEDRI